MRNIIPPAFLALAAWFVWGSPSAFPELPRPVSVDPADLDPAATRAILTDPPTTEIGGFEQSCSSCHSLFRSDTPGSTGLRQHQEIVLAHGLNDRCVNCHDESDRNRLVLRDGTTIGYATVQDLCAQCHGPTFRDWERGIHGRAHGAWDPNDAARSRLVCTHCHDPHAPAFARMAPLPGPNTLRMGEPADHEHDAGRKRNPLRPQRSHR